MDTIIIYQDETQIDGIVVSPYPAMLHPTNGADKMCLCRCEAAPDGVTVLGTYEEVFADAQKKAIYDRLYPPTYVDEDGNTIQKPEKFGVFA